MAEARLRLSSTLISDIGHVRHDNQDSGFAGSRIIAVADGMGGHAGGDTASTVAIRTLSHLEHVRQHRSNIESVAITLEKSILAAHDAIVGKAKKEQQLSGMGTTVDAVCLIRNYWVLAHIGDSRAYLLRDGRLIRATKDHSYVQHLIDTHRITLAEAKNHPQRSVVMRVLGDFDIDPHPDISIRQAQPGDRWLLCSDGLSGPLEDDTIREILLEERDREQCAQKLVNAALRAGSTDNVTAVVGDATHIDSTLRSNSSTLQTPLVGGAAANSLPSIADIVHRSVVSAPHLKEVASPAQKAAFLLADIPLDEAPKEQAPQQPPAGLDLPGINRLEQGQQIAVPVIEHPDEAVPDTGEIPIVTKSDGSIESDPSTSIVTEAISRQKEQDAKNLMHQKKRKRIRHLLIVLLLCLVLGGGTGFIAHWTQSQYYLGESNGYVAIYQGVPTNIFGMSLSHEVSTSTVKVASLPESWQQQLSDGISAGSYQIAEEHIKTIENQAQSLKNQSTADDEGVTK